MPKKKLDLTNHILIPKHSKLNDKEKKELLEKYNVGQERLPQISKKDPALKNLNVKAGDVIKIERKSPTTGTYIFYRSVINE